MSGILHGAMLGSLGIVSAFPTVEATASTTYASGVSSPQNFNLPSSIAAGELLLLVLGGRGNETITAPSGWTELINNHSGSMGTLAAFYKTASGSEGSTVSVSWTSTSTTWGGRSYRFSNYTGTPFVSSNSTGADNSPNSPNLSPGSSAKYLWISASNCIGSGSAFSSGPSGYTDESVEALGIARRTNEASSEDPGVFTTSSSDGWNAITIAIKGT